MSRSKVSILSKYVLAIAILALLFSVSLTTARYAVNQSSTVGVDIDSFDVEVKLYHDLGNGEREQVTGDINLDTNVESLSSYKEIYYLDITNNDRESLYYKVQEETGNFCFTIDSETVKYTTYAGNVDSNSSIELTLTISVHPDVLSELEDEKNRTLTISLYAEYQHSDVYESVYIEEEEPEPEPEDENHKSENGWTALTSSNISTYTSLTSGSYQFYLAENIDLGSSYFNWSNVSATVCLNNHTLTGTASYIFYLNSGSSLTVEDCQVNGSISINSSSSQAIYLNAGTTLTMSSGTINGGSGSYAIYLVSNSATLNLSGTPVIEKGTIGGVYLPSGATINLVGELTEGANIGVTSATSITDSISVKITSSETGTYYYESAIKYIHSDNSNYKVSAGHSGYLSLIASDMINITVAVHGTNGTNNMPDTFYLDGFDWTGTGDGSDSSKITRSTSKYSGTYTYDQYYDFGIMSTGSNYTFYIAPDPYAWSSNLDQYGLSPTDSFASDLSSKYCIDANFCIYGQQYYGQHEAQDGNEGWWQGSQWQLNFYNMSDKSQLTSTGDLTLVLEVDDYSKLCTSWDNMFYNNFVSNAYFVVDGVQQNLV